MTTDPCAELKALLEAERLHDQGREAEAVPFAECAVAAALELLGSHPCTARSLNLLATLYAAQARYDEADARFRELLTMVQAAGAQPSMIAGALINIGFLAKRRGRLTDALLYYDQALGLLRSVPGDDPQARAELATALNNRGELLRLLARFDEAQQMSDESLALRRRLVGEHHADYARTLATRALLRRDQVRYREAEQLARQMLEIYGDTLDPDHPEIAEGLNTLAGILFASGRLRESRDAYAASLDRWRERLDARHPRLAVAMSNLAGAEIALGRADVAMPLYRQALQLLRVTTTGPDPSIASVLDSLAATRYENADYRGAAQLYDEAVGIWTRAIGPSHPDLAKSLGGLAACLAELGERAAAIPLSRHALAMLEASVGPDHPDTATAQANLANMLIQEGDTATARELLQRALATVESTLGVSPALGGLLNSIGGLEQSLGRHEAAVEQFERARDVQIETLGEHHPDVATTLVNLARSRAAGGRYDAALRDMERATTINDEALGRVLAIASDRERTVYLDQAREALHTLLSLVSASLPTSTAAVRLALGSTLRRKGISADALAAQRDAVRAGDDPRLLEQLQRLRELRAELARRALANGGNLGALVEEREQLEHDLAQAVPELANSARLRNVDPDAITRELPAESALVEVILSRTFDFAAVPQQFRGARYLAFVVTASEVTLVDLGDAQEIDDLIHAYLVPLIRGGAQARHLGIPAGAEQDAGEGDAEAVRRGVFDPLRPALGTRRRLFVSPDAGLARLPLESLPSGQGHLIDEYEISYLSTGRDLMRFATPAVAKRSPVLVVSDPNFDLGLPQPVVPDRLWFDRLPGTEREGRKVAARVGVQPLSGDAASEEAVKAARSPAVLHLATHGFFLDDRETWTLPLGARGPENALLRSGLALAGSNASLRGVARDGEDGILYAEDVTGLDLMGTELVVLSACNSGLGDVRAGEGVFGLRRAFTLAGADTLVMSLWPVPDDVTQDLMEAFYDALLGGAGRAQALRSAQLAIRARARAVADWGAFICEGRPEPLMESSITRD